VALVVSSAASPVPGATTASDVRLIVAGNYRFARKRKEYDIQGASFQRGRMAYSSALEEHTLFSERLSLVRRGSDEHFCFPGRSRANQSMNIYF
jgi:hypothetical protein